MNKPNVGDKLFLVNAGVNVRGKPIPTAYWPVTKAGRKYFVITNPNNLFVDKTFHIDTWLEKTEYTSNWSLYESEEKYNELIAASKWQRKFNDAFGGMSSKARFSLEQYEDAAKIFGLTIGGDKK